MASNYPTSLDTATQQPSPGATTDLDASGYEHHLVHTNASEALIALETKLGIGSSAASGATDGHVMTRQADGSTAWEAIPAAATPTVITVADTTDTSCSVALFESATGDLAPKTDGGATYNAGTGTLTATAFAGALTGNVTGNCSGTAATVTGAAQSAITSVGTLSAVTVTGAVTAGSVVAPLAINAQTGTTYTFADGDQSKLVTASNGSAQTYTVPPNSSAVSYTHLTLPTSDLV